MKKINIKVLFAVMLMAALCISALAAPGFAYGENELAAFAPLWESIQADETVISLTPGSVQGEIRFAWLSMGNAAVAFMISESSDMTGAKLCEVKTSEAVSGYSSNKVTVNGLEEGQTYYYSYTENGVWSEPAAVKIQPDDEFTVLFFSDAQIGRSGDETLEEVLVRDTCGWNYTVNKMLEKYPDAAFAISAGDQFQSADSITQMKAYLSPESLRSLPVANTIGNHDDDSSLYSDIFNNPNEVDEMLASPAGTGYYYLYGDALFITVNSNNSFMFDTANLLEQATQAHPEAKWRVVTMHHNPYSVTRGDGEFSEERLFFATLFDCYDIDLVLSGHDHIYSRTSAMYGGKKADGEGTVYVQSTSASGSNYDDMNDAALPSFTAAAFDTNIPTYTALDFTESAIIGTTYRTDTDEVIDEFAVRDNTSNSQADLLSVALAFLKTLFSMI